MVDHVNPKIAHNRGFHTVESPAHQPKICSSPLPPPPPPHTNREKLPPLNFYSPLSPLNNNFQFINLQKQHFSCRHCSCFIVLISYSLDTQVILKAILRYFMSQVTLKDISDFFPKIRIFPGCIIFLSLRNQEFE